MILTIILLAILDFFLFKDLIKADAPYKPNYIKLEEKSPKDLEEGDYFVFKSFVTMSAVKCKVLRTTDNNIYFEVTEGSDPYKTGETNLFSVRDLNLRERYFVYLGI